MDIRSKNVNGIVSYCVEDIENAIKRDRMTFLMDDTTYRCCPKTIHENDGWIFEDSLIDLMTYLYKTECLMMCLAIKEHVKAQKAKGNKRAYSTSHRIEVAFKTRWRCAHCRLLLQPDFEVDHIVELRYGGKDEWNNLCALCVACHSKKTRANTLRKDRAFKKEFGKRAMVIEDTIFETLKYKPKTSKYFT